MLGVLMMTQEPDPFLWGVRLRRIVLDTSASALPWGGPLSALGSGPAVLTTAQPELAGR